MQQQIRSEAADCIKVFLQFISECNSEEIINIHPYLLKVSQKDCMGVLFWLTMYTVQDASMDYEF